MTKRPEEPPTIVPTAQQVGTAHPLWRHAKPCVWTPRMLTALLTGAEDTKWFRLFDKVFAERNLWTALQQVDANDGAPGVDHVTVDEFTQQLPENLRQLSDSLQADNPHEGEPSTGEPDAGDPPVRFGGEGGRNQSACLTPISGSLSAGVAGSAQTSSAIRVAREVLLTRSPAKAGDFQGDLLAKDALDD